ncbi:bifunctional ADP-dependent (S)-NAD(P)H-hydrate dehydratase/NAD(P)H-hydrate epimerase [Methyloprofundus sedimenti]|uniref:Bifunctional NAD(P)H-hydrate repair enzyme n=1 Tax=Methyloprofundus sedimenti TaxID=1420851 RepID=A0A1V8M9A6_9GAMM|nr:NAD(P)H-hydrate dehydratase [Methyloprofundus sedimenti]OQK18145.1 bifunctional ADP-dependent (S)-NAD(P)H-hydrate dehydratase/NAD(P)H-hydrate epimerase [Methyloprofundus sedimenti]
MQTLPTQLYSAQQARDIDRMAQELPSITGFQLMTKAAQAGFKAIQKYYPSASKISVLCGAGNNAGDGYLIAAIAIKAGYLVQLVSLVAEEKLHGDAARAKQEFIAVGGKILQDYLVIDHATDLVVDALFGTGLDRAVTGYFADAISYINTLSIPVLAVDIPSGLNADTGNIMGCAIVANMTITFIVLKKGLYTGLAADYCGTIIFADLAVPDTIIQSLPSKERLLIPSELTKRNASAHKGHFGHVLIVGGDYGYAGAVHLAAVAALNSGAGLVSVATRREHALQTHICSPELMGHALEQLADITELLAKATVLVLGPGMAQGAWAKSIWPTLIALDLPRVIDADALNLLANEPTYSDNWILTPHPGEAARLLHCSTADILQDRYAAVRILQKEYGGVCILKGSGTLICAGDEVDVNTTGNPGMASGGMGDVLSGLIGSLLAQKYSLIEAARQGVYLHGLAADKAAASKGQRGLRASNVLQFLTEVVN